LAKSFRVILLLDKLNKNITSLALVITAH